MLARDLSIGALAAASIAFGLSSTPSLAQGEKQNVRLLVGMAAGGTTDITARALAEKLRESLGQTVTVENKVGAGQRIALSEAKKAAPDGRTLIVVTDSPFVIFPHTYAKLDYDPVTDFTPISRILTFELAVAVDPKLPARNLKELIAWAKANPNQATYGTPGAGTLPHFLGIVLGKTIGVELLHVPYKGAASSMPDLVSGQIPIMIDGLSAMAKLHDAGKIRFLASTGQRRSPLAPDVPTLMESGIDMAAEITVSVYGPAKMPANIVRRLNIALVQAVTSPDFRDRFSATGLMPSPSTPEELAAIQAAQLKFWEMPIKASGFKAD
jgi:tripartite-type tricarboxylate transporter receptor subunit TctC